MDLTSLIPMLRSHGVLKFEGYGIKVELEGAKPDYPLPTVSISPSIIPTPPVTSQLAKPGEPDFQADDLMSYDKIRDWSAPDDGMDSSELPLAGDGLLPEAES